MILDVVPVIPPELRPMVQLDGGRFATSDLNDLYRRVINRNNRLKRLLDLGAPEIIVNNEKRMLQEAVDALFDNGRRGRPVTGPGNRPLKSLSDMLKGKQGRFRQNLLGKRVDYSGRSVIVVGPTLKLHQCGLPKLMALELFKPFVMKKLVDAELAQNIKSAKRMVERRRPQVWDVLEEVIKEHPVLLNRAPTLHRLGIQAFEPVLVEGKAIQIHPLVCHAFNADFDGDQMAVHLPLSAEAQAEARVLMLSANNILSPADGRPLVTPTQDMIIGAYYLTEQVDDVDGTGRVFRQLEEIERAYEAGDVSLHATIELRTPDHVTGTSDEGRPIYRQTTPGRVFFNTALPEGFDFQNVRVDKKVMGRIVDELAHEYPKAEVAGSLDRIKDLCFRYATKSGLTISIDDVRTPGEKQAILDKHEKEADKVEEQFRRGIITDGERRQKEVEIWTTATDEVKVTMEEALKATKFNPIEMMVGSGARGNMMQVRQIAGMRGLVANPRGDMIPRPIKSNFREGLSMLEYFIATPGARKGLVDTALRTADSGYLTRRLVDVAQELIINDEDPFATGGPVRGIWLEDIGPDAPGKRTCLETRLYSRTLADDVALSDGTVLPRGTLVGADEMATLRDDPKVTRVRVLSPLTDDSERGISAASYGLSLATGKLIEVGEAVGVIAAQSIGEPGTQLTMRTFHTGGVAGAGGDIAGGLPRVVELFEARSPKGKATLSRTSGVVRIADDEGKGRVITVVGRRRHRGVLHRSEPVPPRGHRRPGDPRRRSHRRRSPRSQGAARDQGHPGDPAVPGHRGPEGVPGPGRVDPRQAHRADRASDDAPDRRAGAGRLRLPPRRAGRPEGLPRRQPGARPREQGPGRGSPRDDGHHQGVALHRLVAVGGVVPGDHPGAHRGRHRVAQRLADRPQGEHHHRQADPGRYRHARLPRDRRLRAGLPADGVLLLGARRRGRHRGVAGQPQRCRQRRPGRRPGRPGLLRWRAARRPGHRSGHGRGVRRLTPRRRSLPERCPLPVAGVLPESVPSP